MDNQAKDMPDLKYSKETFRDMYEALKRLVREQRPYAYQGQLGEAEKAIARAEGKNAKL